MIPCRHSYRHRQLASVPFGLWPPESQRPSVFSRSFLRWVVAVWIFLFCHSVEVSKFGTSCFIHCRKRHRVFTFEESNSYVSIDLFCTFFLCCVFSILLGITEQSNQSNIWWFGLLRKLFCCYTQYWWKTKEKIICFKITFFHLAVLWLFHWFACVLINAIEAANKFYHPLFRLSAQTRLKFPQSHKRECSV